MRKPKRVIFWQNELAILQSATIRTFCERNPNLEVIWAAEYELSKERVALGWKLNDAGRARILVAPDSAQIRQLTAEAPDESVHICSGIGAFPMVNEAFRACAAARTQLGVFSESCDFRGLRGVARRLLWRTNALRYNRSIDFMIVAGKMGEDWFRQSGFSEQKIYPFGYFTETPPAEVQASAPGAFRLLYIGQYIPRKGLDILFRSLAQCRQQDWRLTGVGVGQQQTELMELAKRLEIADRIELLPPVPNTEIQSVLKTADVLVLPSRFDGWGAVVNEALMCGVPVICSDRCGAADLLGKPWRGDVFKAESVSSLTEVLAQRFSQGKRTIAETLRLQDWSRCIHAETAADYLYQVILASREGRAKPPVPWRQENSRGIQSGFPEEQYLSPTEKR